MIFVKLNIGRKLVSLREAVMIASSTSTLTEKVGEKERSLIPWSHVEKNQERRREKNPEKAKGPAPSSLSLTLVMKDKMTLLLPKLYSCNTETKQSALTEVQSRKHKSFNPQATR